MPKFDIQCPYVTIVSSTLLCGDDFVISIILQNILESFAASRFLIANFKHLWLIKSFSIFTYRTIINVVLGEKEKELLEARGINDLVTY